MLQIFNTVIDQQLICSPLNDSYILKYHNMCTQQIEIDWSSSGCLFLTLIPNCFALESVSWAEKFLLRTLFLWYWHMWLSKSYISNEDLFLVINILFLFCCSLILKWRPSWYIDSSWCRVVALRMRTTDRSGPLHWRVNVKFD